MGGGEGLLEIFIENIRYNRILYIGILYVIFLCFLCNIG